MAGVCLVAVCITGCTRSQPEPPAADTAAAVRPAVPLRVCLVGDRLTADAIQQAWSGISDQTLDVTLVPVDAEGAAIVRQASATDVIIFPAARTATLVDAQVLSELPDAVLDEQTLDAASLLAALRSGPMQFGGQKVAIPLGSVQPALLVAAADWDDAARPTWQQYQQWIAELPAGRSAEPLADGWAAMMFLWRANSYSASTWLFDRDGFRPLLTQPPYEQALTELVQAAEHYPAERMTPQQVWQAILSGRLDAAIGWPAGPAPDAAIGDVRVLPPPTGDRVFVSSLGGWRPAEGQADPVLLSAREPVVAIAASCRQTAAARQFLQWIAGADAVGLRHQLPEWTVTRALDADTQADAAAGHPVTDRYDAWLRGQLSGSRLRPMLRLPGAHEYLQTLDAQVVAALEGRKQVSEALRDAAVEWDRITDRYDRSEQQRAWRRSQGLRF